MRGAVGEMTENLGARIAGLSAALQAVESAFRTQTQHIDTVSTRSRETADAFGRVAGDVRAASQPILTQSERVAHSADRMATSIAGSVDQLSAAQQTASGIAQQLSTHMEQIGRVWDEIGRVWERYEARFTQVDEELGRAADRFREEVSRHQDAMRTFVQDVDRHTESILSRISSAVGDLDGSIQELSDTLAPFVRGMKRGEAAE
jgi:ABC-type transporter Mla subunit MlaD